MMNAPGVGSAIHEHVVSDHVPSRANGIVTVTGVANRGLGVARVDGKVVFLPMAAPGDRVAYSVEGQWRRYTMGRVVEILAPGPDRVRPFCPLFGLCGGCQLQHLSYEAQRSIKRSWIQDAFKRIGRIDAVVEEVVASPARVDYRNKMSLHIRRGTVGLVRAHTHDIVDVPSCPVAEPRLQEAWPVVRQWARSVPYGEAFRLTLRAGRGDSMLVVVYLQDPAALRRLAEALPWAQVVTGGSRATLSYECRGMLFDVEPGTFFQVNSGQLEGMAAALAALVPPGAVVVDGHAGVGWPSLCFAPELRQLVCIEVGRRSHELGVRNARRAGHEHVTFHRGTLATVRDRGRLPPSVDVLLLDPPRGGLLPRDLEAAAVLAAPSVIYVSCDPATQARDIRALADRGWGVVRIIPFDLFPHTAHVESIALLSRGR